MVTNYSCRRLNAEDLCFNEAENYGKSWWIYVCSCLGMKAVWKDNQRVWEKKEERERKRKEFQKNRKWGREWGEVRWVGKMECRSEGGDSWKRRRGWDPESGKEMDNEEREVHTAGRALTEAMWDYWNNKSHDITSWVGCERGHCQTTYSHNNITSNSLVSTMGPNGDRQNLLSTLLKSKP